jgi:hypothetical protein
MYFIMYITYKQKYLAQKKMLGGTQTKSLTQEFVDSINSILQNENKDDVFTNIKKEYTPPNEHFFFNNIFDNNKNNLINIILNLPIDSNEIIRWIKSIFQELSDRRTGQGQANKYIVFIISQIINKIDSDPSFKTAISAGTNDFDHLINSIYFVVEKTNLHIILTDEIVENYNDLYNRIDSPIYQQYVSLYFQTFNRQYKNSIELHKLVNNFETNFPTIATYGSTILFDVHASQNTLRKIIDQIINDQEKIKKLETLILYAYNATPCEKILGETHISEPTQLFTMCEFLLSFLMNQNLVKINELIVKPDSALTLNEKIIIYKNYLELAKRYSIDQLVQTFKLDMEKITRIKGYKYLYLPSDGVFNYNFWEGIISLDEIESLKTAIQQVSSTGIIQSIKTILPYYYSEQQLSHIQHLIIYTLLYVIGTLNQKLRDIHQTKIVIKGGKALQFRADLYPSDDIDLLVISGNKDFAKVLSFNLSILVKWLIESNPAVSIKFPNLTPSNPYDNINIVKMSYLSDTQQYIPIADIDFLQYDPTSTKPNFFAENILETISVEQRQLKFYIQNLQAFTSEKIYYYVEYCCNEYFFMDKFSKSIKFIFIQILNNPNANRNQVWKSFKQFVHLTNPFYTPIMQKWIPKTPGYQDPKRVGLLFENIFNW